MLAGLCISTTDASEGTLGVLEEQISVELQGGSCSLSLGIWLSVTLLRPGLVGWSEKLVL